MDGKTNLERWLLSIDEQTIIDEICNRGCPWCPAVEYCKASPLRCCKEVLAAWAKERDG